MNHWIKILSIMFIPIFSAQAAQVKIDWKSSEKYRDLKSANQTKSKFQKHFFDDIEEYVTDLATSLGESQLLKITVTNVDLAGEIRYMVGPNNHTVRVVRDIDFPRMEFNYQLLDKNKTIITQGNANIKDMSFMTSIRKSLTRDSFHYEKNMLNDWFQQTFPVKQ